VHTTNLCSLAKNAPDIPCSDIFFEDTRAKDLPNSLIKRGVYNGKHNSITKETTLPASNHPTFSPP
jgi:hypothetical protein